MNLLLLDASEVGHDRQVCLRDRRAAHLRDVLEVTVGHSLRFGFVDGARGEGTVVEASGNGHAAVVRLQLPIEAEMEPIEAAFDDVLLLAMPRPLVFSRLLSEVAALGFSRIVIFRSERVEKSYFQAHCLRSDSIQADLRNGLEQACRTRLPEVVLEPAFRPFVTEHLESLVTPDSRFVAHPAGDHPLETLRGPAGSFTLVIGPEGGLLPAEVAAFQRREFLAVSAGPHPLRVSTAFSTISAQLALLRRLRAAGRLEPPSTADPDRLST